MILNEMGIGKHEILILSASVCVRLCFCDLSLFCRHSDYGPLIQTLQCQIFPLRSVNEKYIFQFPWLDGKQVGSDHALPDSARR